MHPANCARGQSLSRKGGRPTRPPRRDRLHHVNLTATDCTLWLIRHGETTWNLEGRIQGQSESPLSESGRRQARGLGARLATTRFDRVLSSDLGRAVETARLAFPGREPELEPRLREQSAGSLEGRRVSELTPAELEGLRGLTAARAGGGPAGAEPYPDLLERARAWLAGLRGDGVVACVTHGGFIQAVLRLAFGQTDPAGWPTAPRVMIANTSITELRFVAGRAVVARVNDHAHLEGV